MNRKTLSAACLTALIGLPGCALFNKPAEPEAPVSYDTQQQYCPGGVCETDPFINYTQTRAPFRQEGELSPRDRLVSQSGAGNNLSASIPPSIEDEVINYETQVETQSAQEVQPTAVANEQKPVQSADDVNVSTADEANNAVSDKQAAQTDNRSAGENTPVAQTQTAEQPASEATPEEIVVSQEVLVEEPSGENDNQTDDEGEDAVRDWYAEEGQNLKALLTEWSEQSGWRLVWNTNRNYVLNAGAMFRGRFADVSSALIRAFARARPAPVATFYKGNRVLVVETMEDENAFD